MSLASFDLVPIWTVILGMAVFFYVLLDGFDLGVGMLFGLAPDTPSRNLRSWIQHRARCGTATRPGWCSARSGCWRPFRWLSRSSSRRSISRSC